MKSEKAVAILASEGRAQVAVIASTLEDLAFQAIRFVCLISFNLFQQFSLNFPFFCFFNFSACFVCFCFKFKFSICA